MATQIGEDGGMKGNLSPKTCDSEILWQAWVHVKRKESGGIEGQ